MTQRKNTFLPVATLALIAIAVLLSTPFTATASTSVGGIISTDTTWTLAGSPYIVTSSITVQGVDGADGVTKLTIEPGVEVRFNRYTQLTVGASSGSPGALIAQGTAENPIVFTSNLATPSAGDWDHIYFRKTADGASSILCHCVVQYGGTTNYGMVRLDDASPSIVNCTITSSKGYGIHIAGGSPVIDGCQFSANGNYDLYYSGAVGGTVANCTIHNGIYLQAAGDVAFSGNAVSQNNSFPIKAYADNMGRIANGCTFSNVDGASYLEITAGNVTKDATWPAVMPYVLSTVTVQGTDGPDGVTTLTIAPGTIVRFKSSCTLNVGASSGSPGALIAQGTAENPIVFTSNLATPSAGDWNHIYFRKTADGASSILCHCVVQYGGTTNYGMVRLDDASPSIVNCMLRYSSHSGIQVAGSGSNAAQIKCNTFNGNTIGIHVSGARPLIKLNNFNGNGSYGLYYLGAILLVAENNWWKDPQGPNMAGDRIYGSVDSDPWSTAENQCIGGGANHPPNVPMGPTPADGAVRVSISNGLNLTWTGGDPDAMDIATYDLYRGTASYSLAQIAPDLPGSSHRMTDLARGVTYYWKVVAKDNHGLQTEGPVWHFTAAGDPPDLIVSGLSTTPAGHLLPGQNVTLTAQVSNIGTGPVVDAFAVKFKAGGAEIGIPAVTGVVPADGTVQVNQSWTYASGDPILEITADAQNAVAETNEQNNLFIALLSEVADNTPPALITTVPPDNGCLQQITQITVTLADSQSAIDTAAVLAGFTVTNSSSQVIVGAKSETNGIFTFVPSVLPLSDDTYQVSITAADIHGNTRGYTFSFTIDTAPPGKPVITGGIAASGIIQPRPAQNISEQVVVELTGTRDEGTSVWINGIEKIPNGSADWSVELLLHPEASEYEVFLKDSAGNQGVSEWVDIAIQQGNGATYEYNRAGRMRNARNNR